MNCAKEMVHWVLANEKFNWKKSKKASRSIGRCLVKYSMILSTPRTYMRSIRSEKATVFGFGSSLASDSYACFTSIKACSKTLILRSKAVTIW